MSKSIHLSIPKPCSEDWSTMTCDERSKHCSACNKSVYPLSEYEEEEAFHLIQKPTVCVRVQYNRTGQVRLCSGFSSLLLLGGLLACGESNEDEHLMGDLMPVEQVLTTEPGQAVQVQTNGDGDKLTEEPERMGKIAASTQGDVPTVIEQEMGEVMLVEDSTDSQQASEAMEKDCDDTKGDAASTTRKDE